MSAGPAGNWFSAVGRWVAVSLGMVALVIVAVDIFVMSAPQASPSPQTLGTHELLECLPGEMIAETEISYRSVSGRPGEPAAALEVFFEEEGLEGIAVSDVELVLQADQAHFAVVSDHRRAATAVVSEIDDGWAVTEWAACGSWLDEFWPGR